MGAVLAQAQNGKQRAIWYASKAFSKTRTRYSATKRELLSIVHFKRHFWHYLLGRKFTIITDHRVLQWLHNFKDTDGLTARWLEKLAVFDCEVQHKPGKSIGHADVLSCIPQATVQIIQHDPKVVDLSDVKRTVEDEWPNAKPRIDPSTLPTEVHTTPHQAPRPPNPSSSANPNKLTWSWNLRAPWKNWQYIQLQRFSCSLCFLGLQDECWNRPCFLTKVSDKLPEVWHSASKITLATISRVKSTIHLPPL